MKKVVVIVFFLSFIWVALGKGTMVFAQFSTAGQVIEYESLDSLVVKVNDGFGGAKITEHTYNETTRKGTMRFDIPVEVLADSVFHDCDSLISMTLPVQLKRIGDYAFFSCQSLKSITIPNSLTSIGEGSFYFCGKLTSINIPKNVTHIGGGAFFRCNAMANFTVAVDNPKYDSRQNCNALIETATNKLLYGFASSVIPESVTQIGDSAFYFNTAIRSVNIPNSITSIGDDAFYNCWTLSSINIPNSVTYIGVNAFRFCHALKTIVIGGNVAQIGDHAFQRCSSLQKCYVCPMTPPQLGDSVFHDLGANAQLYISCAVMDKYVADSNWGVYQSHFRDGGMTIYHHTTPDSVYEIRDQLVARITYKRRVTPGKWETLYLPFDLDRVTVTDADGEWDLIPWQQATDSGHYYLAQPCPDGTGIVFEMTSDLESHRAYIMQFPDIDGYYDDKFVTFYSTPEWKSLGTSYTPVEQDDFLHMEGNTTLCDQKLTTPVYMLRGTTNFQLQSSTTTLHPFECYVMPNYTSNGTSPRKMSIRWRDNVTTDLEDSKVTTMNDLTYVVEGNMLTIFAAGRSVNIYAINGTLLYASSMADDVRVNLDKGCYLLQCGDVTKKIML